MNKPTTVSFINLGCFKNVVDTEVLGGMLADRGMRMVSSYESADWVIINTCGFIQAAKEESITEILRTLEEKESGRIGAVAVFGCLAQRYLDEIRQSFPEVDLIWGVNDLQELADVIAGKKEQEYSDRSLFLYDHSFRRIPTTSLASTFLKISEGCDMSCTFCAIPAIRGDYRSRTIDSILKEAATLREKGYQEINLISQNSTHFGRDRENKPMLPELLKQISRLDFPWIRVLYLMPEQLSDAMVQAFDHPSILPYFDLPFQHAASSVLKAMGRGGSAAEKARLIENIRRAHAGAVIRSSFMVGFPGETDADFEELCDFVRETRIERAGVFVYSPEEGTRAFSLKSTIPAELAEERKQRLLDISDENMAVFNRGIQNSKQPFLPLGPWDNNSTIGRIAAQAPDVDGLTRLDKPFEDSHQITDIRITGFEHELLHGEPA